MKELKYRPILNPLLVTKHVICSQKVAIVFLVNDASVCLLDVHFQAHWILSNMVDTNEASRFALSVIFITSFYTGRS